MIKNPVKQTLFTNEEDYNFFWETKVSKLVEAIYSSETNFISAYSSNPNKVCDKLVSNMRVVPIDIKESLGAFFKALIDAQPLPPDGALLG